MDRANQTTDTQPQQVIDADMANPPKLDDLKSDLEGSQPYHSAFLAKLQEWRDSFSLSKKLTVRKGKSKVQPKLIRKQAEWTYPDISEPFLSTPSLFDAQPNSQQDVDATKQNKRILNRQFKSQINRVRLMDQISRSLVDDGTAILRVSWDFQERVTDTIKDTYEFLPLDPMSEEGQELAQIIQYVASGGDVGNNIPKDKLVSVQASIRAHRLVKAKVNGTKVVQELRVIKNQPEVTVEDLEAVIIDPSCRGNFDKAKFIILEFQISKSDMRLQSGRYFNIDSLAFSNDTESQSQNNIHGRNTDFNFVDDERRLRTAYEYWGYSDINGTGIAEPFVMTWVDNVVIRLEKAPVKETGLPFVQIQYMPDFNNNHGEPDAELLRDNQSITGAITRGMIDTMARSANGQVGYRSDALDEGNERRFQKGLDFKYRSNVDPNTLFNVFKFDELPQSAGLMLNLQQKEAESLSGTQPFGSEGVKNTNSAQGVRNILDATSKRRMAILRRVSRGLVEVGVKIIALNQLLLSEEEIVRITDGEFVQINRDDLRADFDLTLEVSTAEHDDSKANELAFMLQTAGPKSDPAENRLVRGQIARLRGMPDFADMIENFQPEPDPLEVKKAELEIQLLEAQIANEYAKAHENQANGNRDLEMVNTEKAKQAKLLAEADSIDLDYVEQETGTKQERDKELAVLNHLSKMEQDAFKQSSKERVNAKKQQT